MLFRPEYPQNPTLPAVVVRPADPAQHPHAPVCACHHTPAPAPVSRRPAGPVLATGAGAVVAVVALGVVLTALVTAVAIGAVSVAVCAVVLRSLLANHHRRY